MGEQRHDANKQEERPKKHGKNRLMEGNRKRGKTPASKFKIAAWNQRAPRSVHRINRRGAAKGSQPIHQGVSYTGQRPKGQMRTSTSLVNGMI